jgi:hypothetical protein
MPSWVSAFRVASTLPVTIVAVRGEPARGGAVLVIDREYAAQAFDAVRRAPTVHEG